MYVKGTVRPGTTLYAPQTYFSGGESLVSTEQIEPFTSNRNCWLSK